MKRILLLVLVIMNICVLAQSKPESGTDVIRMMKEKFNNKYLENFTFAQYIKEYKDGELTNETVWHEAYSFPNHLIIKFDSFESGNGYIFKNDSIYVMNENKISFSGDYLHYLIILGFEVYEDSLESTVSKLTENGYDMSKVYESELKGRPVYVVGTENDNKNRNRFYIDRETLCFLKTIRYNEELEVSMEFTDYKMIKGKYIATKVLFYEGGKLVMTEEYFNMNFPNSIDHSIFNPKNFEKSRW